MSFFRNIRTSITRGRSSSRDTTPVPNARPASVVGNAAASSRRDSVESRTDLLFNRSDTFILSSDHEEQNPSNSSTLEKKSKKSKVLSKFSTFTKRKKTPSPEHSAGEHHPSDNATNTYYKWQTDGAPSLDYDSQSDPFNFLYEQQSSLRATRNGNAEAARHNAAGNGLGLSANTVCSSGASSAFDSSTYRKGKMPAHLRNQLAQLKSNPGPELRERKGETPEPPEETAIADSDKYKTVTLNSFRKSFRERFLQQQKDAPHNPAWFVEVEPPPQSPAPKSQDTRALRASKENRPDLFVYDNENYRPTSRSPVRSEHSGRSNTRSPVKRNETFRVERPEAAPHSSSRTGAIRIEIKNSITPNVPGRMVPVGVAKPMPSQFNHNHNHNHNNNNNPNNNSHYHHLTKSSPLSVATTADTTPASSREKSPLRNWGKPITVSPVRHRSNAGRYQTLVQIRNDANSKPPPHSTTTTTAATAMQAATPPPNRSRLATRIQLGAMSPTVQRRLNSAGGRYSLATANPVTAHAPKHTLSSYELLKHATPQTTATHAKPHTYFGDAPLAARNNHSGRSATGATTATTARTFGGGGLHGAGGTTSTGYAAASRLQQPARSAAVGGMQYPTRPFDYHEQQQQRQQQQREQLRYPVPVQRRSRSPTKMPWR